jgi:hypothetical protein
LFYTGFCFVKEFFCKNNFSETDQSVDKQHFSASRILGCVCPWFFFYFFSYLYHQKSIIFQKPNTKKEKKVLKKYI